MNLQNLLSQFIGSDTGALPAQRAQGVTSTWSKVTGSIPGGLAGGAAAGGIMALLMSNKSARKFAGTAATMGGAALLGGLAYKAFKNWQQANQAQPGLSESDFTSAEVLSGDFQLTLIKAMIAAAKADGHIDNAEQQRIHGAIDQMDLPAEMRGLIFDLLGRSITIEELTGGAQTVEQKSELYLATCLVIDPDHPAEQAHLQQLAAALQLPPGLTQQLQMQARQTMAAA